MRDDEKEVAFRIRRFKPGVIDPPRFQTFSLKVGPHMTVLDCLERIRLQQAPSLMYRHSCHHASCGTCACIVNGQEALACTANVWELGVDEITLEPLKGYRCIGDLFVDTAVFFASVPDEWSCLKTAETPAGIAGAAGRNVFVRFENCIECACCVSVCPPSQENALFMGPAALAAIHSEIKKTPQKTAALLALAGGERGERHCRRALACSRVCPSDVYPARRISSLRKTLASRNGITAPANQSGTTSDGSHPAK